MLTSQSIYLNNKKLLITVLEASSDGVLISDDKGNIVYVNKAYEVTTGLLKEQLIDQNLDKLRKENVFNVAVSLSVLKEGKTVSTIHKYVTGKSALTTASPIRNEDGKIMGVICNTRNISKLMKLRNELTETKKLTEKYSNQLQQLRKFHMEYKNIIFKSKVMGQTLQLAAKVASFDSTILINGESGTGKEVLAKFIHQQSSRKNGPFIKVNCAAIPNELFESELFGYEPGAFTGAAQKGKVGIFELANEGTILLDEVAELSLNVQSKLLRVLQEKQLLRVGGNKGIKLNVRILAATNKNLLDEVKKGNFREDLFFRLNVIPIRIPSLRERKEDIPLLISHFIENLNKHYKKNVTIAPEVIEIMSNYSWPGNIRELQNLTEYLFIINSDGDIGIEHLPAQLFTEQVLKNKDLNKKKIPSKLSEIMGNLERNIIISTLKNYPSIKESASVLGIDNSTLWRKIKKYGIENIYIK